MRDPLRKRSLLSITFHAKSILVCLFIFLPTEGFFHIALAQLTGEDAELTRLQDKAEEAMSMGDPHGAALSIGKAALMAALLSKKEESPTYRQRFQGMASYFRAQENTYRAIALFQQSGDQIPASSGVCNTLVLGTQHAKQSKKILGTPPTTDLASQNLEEQVTEWLQTIEELQNEFGCKSRDKKTTRLPWSP